MGFNSVFKRLILPVQLLEFTVMLLILFIQICHITARNYDILISIIPLLETFLEQKMEL